MLTTALRDPSSPASPTGFGGLDVTTTRAIVRDYADAMCVLLLSAVIGVWWGTAFRRGTTLAVALLQLQRAELTWCGTAAVNEPRALALAEEEIPDGPVALALLDAGELLDPPATRDPHAVLRIDLPAGPCHVNAAALAAALAAVRARPDDVLALHQTQGAVRVIGPGYLVAVTTCDAPLPAWCFVHHITPAFGDLVALLTSRAAAREARDA
jgi:hypothetical protein